MIQAKALRIFALLALLSFFVFLLAFEKFLIALRQFLFGVLLIVSLLILALQLPVRLPLFQFLPFLLLQLLLSLIFHALLLLMRAFRALKPLLAIFLIFPFQYV